MSRENNFKYRWKSTPDQNAVRTSWWDIAEQLTNYKLTLGMGRMRTIWPNLPPNSCFSRPARIIYPEIQEVLRSSSIELRKGDRDYSANVSFSEFGPFNPSSLVVADVTYTSAEPEYLFQVMLRLSNRQTSGITIFEHQGFRPFVDSSLQMTWDTNKIATRHDDGTTPLLDKLGIDSKDFTPAYCIALMGVMLNPKLIDATTPDEMFDSIRIGFVNTLRNL